MITRTAEDKVSIQVTCRCGHMFPVKNRYAGKRGKCPSCGQTVQVPDLQASEASMLAAEALLVEPPAGDGTTAAPAINPPMGSAVVRGRMAQTQRLLLAKWIHERLCAQSPLVYGPFEIAGMCVPSSQVGGDYFDFIKLQDGSLGIVIGDASGHGVEAAYLMALIRLCLRALAQSYADVGKIFTLANGLLLGELPPDTFATVGLARLDETTRRLTYVGAGQPPVFVINSAGKTEAVLSSGEGPLGLSADTLYAGSDPVRLNPGDAIVMFTRGILRAPAADGHPFGSKRLLELIHANRRQATQTILQILQQFVRAQNKNLPLSADLTAILVSAK